MPTRRRTYVAPLVAAAACTHTPAPAATAPVPAPALERAAAGPQPPRTGRPPDDATGPADSAARIRRVEQGLLPLHTLRGRPLPALGLLERMRYYQVPGVSVAVINGGRVEWARGYGVLEAGGARSVDARTLFQAASISKPVTAVGALRLVEQGRLALDADVNAHLRTWRVPANAFTARQPVTLRQLLSHTAGTTVHGFDGYPAGVPVPTVVQVLDGAPPANSKPVRVDTTPGTVSRYSGGGYTVVQHLVSDVAGRPFADVMDALVLRPAGMAHSTFAQPLPGQLAERAAAGHRPDGTPLPGRWHTYPEQAAAGLWTTASDLARLAVALQQAFAGRGGAVLSPATTRQMLTLQPPADSYGLGFGVGGEGGSRFFTHPGGNAGYVANLVMFAETGQGAVVLTNREGAVQLTHEILRAVARTYRWPTTGWNALQPTERAAVAADPAALRPLAGRYRLGQETGGPVVVVTAGARGLSARMPDWPEARALYAAGAQRFFFLDHPLELTFEADVGGRVTAVALSAGGSRVRATRVD